MQIAVNEARVAGEHGSPVGIEGSAATGSKGWGEPPFFLGTGKDFVIDGAGILFGQVDALMPGGVPGAVGARPAAAAPAGVDARFGAWIERQGFTHFSF